MYSKNTQRKASKGSVQIKSSNDRLQLVFSHGGKRHYLSLGLPDNKLNHRAAEAKAKLIESDIAYDRFDATLSKYKPSLVLSTVTPEITPNFTPKTSLPQLWEQYTQYKSTQISASTLVRDYGKIAKRLVMMPDLQEAIEVRDWLLKKYSSEVARRTLIQLNACSNWAVKSGLLTENPFRGMASDIKKTVRDTSRQPFSCEERDAILEAFEKDTYASRYSPVFHSYYLPYVRFLFMTGCRPEEAIALRWQHVAKDCSRIRFEEALPSDTRILGETKTGKTRTFPCNGKLQAFLLEIKPEKPTAKNLVFPSPRGGTIDTHNFLNRVWKPVLESLLKDGKVEQYLPQYNIRHSFITLCLENGLDAKDAARLVGNTPEIIYKYYAGAKRQLFVPEF